jgi:hypothetical protein
MLKDGTLYQDLGSNHFDNRAKASKFYDSSIVCNPPFRPPDHPVAA